MYAAEERVQGKLANGNAQAADSLVADAENALAIGDHDHVHFPVRAVAQKSRNRIAQRIGDEQAARPPVDLAELPTPLGNHRRVNDGGHLFNVVEQQAVELHGVALLIAGAVGHQKDLSLLREIADHLDVSVACGRRNGDDHVLATG